MRAPPGRLLPFVTAIGAELRLRNDHEHLESSLRDVAGRSLNGTNVERRDFRRELMNSIRHFVLAGSLCASLAPSVARGATSNSSTERPPAALAASNGPNRPASRSGGAPLSTGLLALGSANEADNPPSADDQSRDASLARREQSAPQLRDFRGGRVYVYLGGGVTLLLVLLLLLILL